MALGVPTTGSACVRNSGLPLESLASFWSGQMLAKSVRSGVAFSNAADAEAGFSWSLTGVEGAVAISAMSAPPTSAVSEGSSWGVGRVLPSSW